MSAPTDAQVEAKARKLMDVHGDPEHGRSSQYVLAVWGRLARYVLSCEAKLLAESSARADRNADAALVAEKKQKEAEAERDAIRTATQPRDKTTPPTSDP